MHAYSNSYIKTVHKESMSFSDCAEIKSKVVFIQLQKNRQINTSVTNTRGIFEDMEWFIKGMFPNLSHEVTSINVSFVHIDTGGSSAIYVMKKRRSGFSYKSWEKERFSSEKIQWMQVSLIDVNLFEISLQSMQVLLYLLIIQCF